MLLTAETRLGRRATGAFHLLLAVTRPIQSDPTIAGRLIADRIEADDPVDGAFRSALGEARRQANALDADAARRAWDWTTELLARP
jgi:hypothetical protein